MSDKKEVILVATDLDGTFGKPVFPLPPSPPTICISGRTFDHYDLVAKQVATKMPLYIRGVGSHGIKLPQEILRPQ